VASQGWSDGSPIFWNLTSGTTSPPEGFEPMVGATGKVKFLKGGLLLSVTGNVLADNAWSAPKTSGCGGLFSFLLDPIVSAASGVPAGAGVNKAKLETRSTSPPQRR
jgi:hypothetical protein